MQSDEENFEESLETQSPVRRTVDPEDRFPLRNTPARRASEKLREAKMDQQNLFEGLTKSSAAATPNPNATGFASEECHYHPTKLPNHLQLRKTTRRKKRRIDYRR